MQESKSKKEIEQKFVQRLILTGIEEKEAKKEISILLKELGENNFNQIEDVVNKRVKSRTPLQYLIGKAYFMDFEVKVNNKVLIPRPETEILVEETICRSTFKFKSAPDTVKILDIGTGSGIIAIALARLIPNSEIIAIDIEKEIIDVAYENAKQNNVQDKIQFSICDIFSKQAEVLFENNDFDLVISNPPYIKEVIYNISQPEVKHEPKIALCGSMENKTGLIYYERIVTLICRRRPVSTMLAFEIDPPLVKDLETLLSEEKLSSYEIVKDYNGLDRCLFVSLGI